jgi:hypothetical protein
LHCKQKKKNLGLMIDEYYEDNSYSYITDHVFQPKYKQKK